MSKTDFYIDPSADGNFFQFDLFEDENIQLSQNVQNVRDISKTFTDFTQSFNVPGSGRNNIIFKHWYNPDITGGFDTTKRKPARLYLNNALFKEGSINLNKAVLKGGKIQFYNITFFGGVVALKDRVNGNNIRFEDAKLSDLDLTLFDHDYVFDNIKIGLETGLKVIEGRSNIIYPLISHRLWTYDLSNSPESPETNIAYNDSDPQPGINWRELKPAIRAINITDAIEADFGILLSREFLDFKHFQNLFLWLSNSKEDLIADDKSTRIVFDTIDKEDFPNSYSTITGEFFAPYDSPPTYFFEVKIFPESGFENIPYTISIVKGVLNEKEIIVSKETIGDGQLAIAHIDLNTGDIMTVEIKPTSTLSFHASFRVEDDPFLEHSILEVSTGSPLTLDVNISISLQMPDIKIIDFMDGLMKLYNLILQSTGKDPVTKKDTFTFRSLDAWYRAGLNTDTNIPDEPEIHPNAGIIDITAYVDMDTIEVVNVPLNREIKFLHEDSETILQDQHKSINKGIQYGDLEHDTGKSEGEILEINVPFENLKGIRLTDEDTEEITRLHIYLGIDPDFNGVDIKPFLFYREASRAIGDTPISLDDSTIINKIIQYVNVNQSDSLNTPIETLNFGAEIDTDALTLNENSLFKEYWSDYIGDLYSPKRRAFNIRAIIPHAIMLNIRLNGRIAIRGRRFIINNITSNLLTGETNFELLNDIYELTPPGVQVGFDYVLEFGLQG